jgi:hypothetical protein
MGHSENVAARKSIPQGLKPDGFIAADLARLKSCPDASCNAKA